jgi:thiol-disulfide isomerase/thioredoxin
MKKTLKIALYFSTICLLLVAGCSSSKPRSVPTSTAIPTQTTTLPATTTVEPAISTSTEPATSAPSVTLISGNLIGNLAIDFQLKNMNGQVVSLSGLRGKAVMLNFWATWCGPCRSEMPLLQQVYETWKDRGLEVLEIDIQEKSAVVQKYMTNNKLTLPTLLDLDGKVSKTYGITAIPATYFIDKDGVIRQVVRGAFPNRELIENQLSKIIP